jgi:hypothetical protein
MVLAGYRKYQSRHMGYPELANFAKIFKGGWQFLDEPSS